MKRLLLICALLISTAGNFMAQLNADEISKVYLEKSKIQPMEMSLEEFTKMVNTPQPMRKTITTATALPPVWEYDFGTDLTELADDQSFGVQISFPFEFYGVEYTSVWVNANGNLSFNKSFQEYDISLPMDTGSPLIDPYVALVGILPGDLYPAGFLVGGVYYNILGDAPNRRFVVTWNLVPSWGGNGYSSFQVQLFECTNKILFGYGDLATTVGLFNGKTGLSHNSYQVDLAFDGGFLFSLSGTNFCFTPDGADSYIINPGACVENVPPVVAVIPDQTINEGESFSIINLDDYVTDENNAPDEMIWTASGQTELSVSITDRIATIIIPSVDWNGSETINFSATDPCGLSDNKDAVFTVNSAYEPPADLIPYAQKLAVRDALAALELSGDKKIDDRIEKAIKHIDHSLNDDLWEDASHLTKKGKKVFDEEKKAVKELEKIVKEKKKDLLKTEARDAIDKLVAVDSALAQIAIDEAIAIDGKTKEIEKALKEMEKAEKELAKCDYDHAIDKYKKAWEHAVKAMKHLVKDFGDFDTEIGNSVLPEEFSLAQNYPNPFNPSTTVEFSLPAEGYYSINVFSLLGEKVAVLGEGYYAAGYHTTQFNAEKLPSGMYIYQLSGRNVNIIKKMILLR